MREPWFMHPRTEITHQSPQSHWEALIRMGLGKNSARSVQSTKSFETIKHFNPHSLDLPPEDLPAAIEPPDGCFLCDADVDELRQAVFPVQEVGVLQRIHQLVRRLPSKSPLLHKGLYPQGGEVLRGQIHPQPKIEITRQKFAIFHVLAYTQ